MKNQAIKENHLYRKVYDGGKKAYGKYTVVYVLKDKKASLLKKRHPRKETVNRVGLTVTKKLGHAVLRNRIKRVLREAYAQIEKTCGIKKGYLVVICAREAAGDAKSTEIATEMMKQFDKLGMLAPTVTQTPQTTEPTQTTSAPQASDDVVRDVSGDPGVPIVTTDPGVPTVPAANGVPGTENGT